jgi:formylmethanofuran dehydrogenase subunit C
MTLRVQLAANTSVPLEVEGILPESLRDRSLSEIEQQPIYHGNTQVPLAEFFTVSGDPADERIEWEGDLSGVHWIGARMGRGEVRVLGRAGRHLGSEMTGGVVIVEGDAGDWVGGEMRGGRIIVQGSAGHLPGAAYRGSPRGMTGGTLLIHGSAGNEVGAAMRRGLIAVGGAGDLAGWNMLAGTVLVFGPSGIRNGAGMRRGTLVFCQDSPPILPTFRAACRMRPPVIDLLRGYLRGLAYPHADLAAGADFEVYNGDLLEGGRGELLVRCDRA